MDDRTVGDVIGQMPPFKQTMLRLMMFWILRKTSAVDIRKTFCVLCDVCTDEERKVAAYLLDKAYRSIGKRSPRWLFY